MKYYIRYLIVIIFCFYLFGLVKTNAADLGNSPKGSKVLRSANNKQLDITLKPLTQNGDRITIELFIKGIYGDLKGDLSIYINVGKEVTLYSPNKFEENLNGEEEIIKIIDLSVPKGISSTVFVLAGSNTYAFGGRSKLFIRNISESMEYSIFPFPAPKVEPLYQRPNWDTMTTEQLSVEYEIYFKLKKVEDYQLIKYYSDTLIPSYKKDVYKARLTPGEILKLAEEKNFEAGFVHRPPWDKRTTPWINYETPPDTTNQTLYEVEKIEMTLSKKKALEARMKLAE